MKICEQTLLETFGRNGWGCYRIPGLVTTAAGTVLAYYETRLDAGDWSARNIGLRRSVDGGRTWSERTELADNPAQATVNNPVMIATASGPVVFCYQVDYDRAYCQISRDDGCSWSAPNEITAALLSLRDRYAWTVFGLGPGHGIACAGGRLLIPVWLCNGGGRAHRPSVVTTLYSDDGGAAWRSGEILPTDGHLVNPNESALVQLRDGRILINMRHESERRRRAVAISPSGIADWSAPWFDEALPDPVCCAGLVRLPQSQADQPLLAFCNCAVEGARSREDWATSRRNLTVRLSADDGLTWSSGHLLAERAGYADLAASPDGAWVYGFFEHDWIDGSCGKPAGLAFVRMNRAWLGTPAIGGQKDEPTNP
jgi:sialidase-1